MTARRTLSALVIIISLAAAIISLVQLTPHLAARFAHFGGTTISQGQLQQPTDTARLAAIIAENPHLKDLNISPQDTVEMLPAEIATLIALERLTIESASFRHLPQEIGLLSSLTFLRVSNTQMAQMPAQIGDLVGLTALELPFNKLTELPPEIGKLTALVTLRLNNNAITHLPATIGDLAALTSLDLRSNRLTTLPEELSRLTNLRYLYLGGNAIDAATYTTLQEMLPNTTIF